MISNITKNLVLSGDCVLCTSAWSKGFGLMFHLKPKTLVFKFNKSKFVPLHNFFVFFPIDVCFLNADKKILEIKENFKPFTIYNPQNKSVYVIELPRGTIAKTNTSVGDILDF